MEVGGQLHAPATLPLRRETPVHIGYEVEKAPEPDALVERRAYFSCRRIEHRFLGRKALARRYPD
jgi:hypothetical protein